MDDVPTTALDFNGDAETSVGPYRLGRQIGEGGMGVVYHARQTHPIRRDVALKVIKPGMDTKQVIIRFETERQALAVMDHPSIARVFDAGTTVNGRPYFVMELVDGIPITQYCDSHGLNIAQRIELFIRVCQAIQHAHQKGVIHRDIKPSNILVVEQDGKPIPKVIDFGLAKALGQQISDASMMTNIGVVVGTPDYMSPEQAAVTRQDVDTRTDVYALGAVLYELLTGTTPLRLARAPDTPLVNVLQMIREQDPPVPSVSLRDSATAAETSLRRSNDSKGLVKVLHGELDWITMRAVEKDRTRRYETVNGLARDLQRYLNGDPVEASPPSTGYRIRKFVQKHRTWLAAAAAFSVLLVVAVVVSASMAIRARRAEQAAIVERNAANAVRDFLKDDLLAQASVYQTGRADLNPLDLTVRTALDRAAARIDGRFPSQPLVEASIRQTIGSTYWKLGLYGDAETQHQRAVDLRRRTLGDEHADTLASMNSLGDDYTYQGKYHEAESVLSESLAISRRVLSDEHQITTDIMNNLALAYERDGKYSQAESLYARALEFHRRILGRDDPQTLNVASNLAVVYYRQAKYSEAEPVFSEVLQVQRRLLGEEHPDAIITMNNLAMTYRGERNYAKAEPLLMRSMETSRRVLGDQHPDTLRRTNNLGLVYLDQQKYAEAETLLVKAMDGRKSAMGADHPDTLTTMAGLASLYRTQRKYDDAESLLLRVLEARRRVLGNGHPDTAATVTQLSELYAVWGRADKADALKSSLAPSKN